MLKFILIWLHLILAIFLVDISANITKEKNNIIKDFKIPNNFISQSPSALLAAVKTGCTSFVTASCAFIPIGLVLNVGSIKSSSFKKWIVKGSLAGIDWAKISAFYSVSIEFTMFMNIIL